MEHAHIRARWAWIPRERRTSRRGAPILSAYPRAGRWISLIPFARGRPRPIGEFPAVIGHNRADPHEADPLKIRSRRRRGRCWWRCGGIRAPQVRGANTYSPRPADAGAIDQVPRHNTLDPHRPGRAKNFAPLQWTREARSRGGRQAVVTCCSPTEAYRPSASRRRHMVGGWPPGASTKGWSRFSRRTGTGRRLKSPPSPSHAPVRLAALMERA